MNQRNGTAFALAPELVVGGDVNYSKHPGSASVLVVWATLSILTLLNTGEVLAVDLANQELTKLRTDPLDYMSSVPSKYNSNDQLSTVASRFSLEATADKSFVTLKDQVRLKLIKAQTGSGSRTNDFAEINYTNDDPKNLVDDGTVVESLEEVERLGLTRSKLAVQPWSGDYWPIYKGNIASRFADPEFPSSEVWKENYDYVKDNPLEQIASIGDPQTITNLSPAEKYSLIVGDEASMLASRLWAEGKYYFESTGKVETWFGICHGWAPAAFMLERPRDPITIPARNHDFSVTLYPADIQALASLAWANSQGNVKFIGGRCQDKDPEKDPNGRITTPDCFDNNPGAWHQAVVGQIGVAKRSMVIDATFDYEVWNQPVLSYSYSYFDPETHQPAGDLAAATRELSSFRNDRFAKYRSPRTKYIVGISMELSYMVEISATQFLTGTETDDRFRKVVYLYDLELDADRKIIGGEWYNNFHPDFIWTPEARSVARLFAEFNLRDQWLAGEKIPESWVKVAGRAANNGQVMGMVVEELVRRSRTPNQ